MDNINVFFILSENYADSTQASEIMIQAFESCQQNAVNVSWIKEAQFDSINFSKTDFVVFEDFKGKSFESLKESKCARIVGPWCILVCLLEGRPIPNFPWPIYNVAMSGCVISCSHIAKVKKLEIREKIQLMGGCYTDSLMSTNTHLITESVKSEKYLQAAESNLKLMISGWVDAVWEASQTNNVHCDNKEFDKYKCLPFYNLTICSTGFPNIDMRTQLSQNVVKNGGVFTASLALAKTDVLVVYGTNGILSQKYKAARSNSNIFCVSVEWIDDSIAKGYALPHNTYVVKKGTSTPTKENETCPDFSMISAIGDVTAKNATTLEETIASRNARPSFPVTKRISPKRKCSVTEDLARLVDGLDIKKAKKAGQYLDGYSVYLTGFLPEQREKLSKVLNLSGATRYDDISDRLTHIIVGDTSCHQVKIIKSKNYSASLVSVHWLLDSIEKQQAVDEENYLINLHDIDKEQFSSPLGRKGLSLLRSNKTLTPNDIQSTNRSSPELEVDNDLMQQYLKPASKDDDSDTLVNLLKNVTHFDSNTSGSTKQTDTSTQNSEFDDRSRIFQQKKFLIVSFTPEECNYIKEQIESLCGCVVSKTYKGIPDYVVAPRFVQTSINISALEIVNNLWVEESIYECEEVNISYYHRPFVVGQKKPLENRVVTISGYTNFERTFLKELIEVLGGVSQEQFARVQCVEKNVLASTHLVSLKPEGKKYVAALKWELPVVSKDWLLECANVEKMVAEDKFLIGDAKVASKPDAFPEAVSENLNLSLKSTPNLEKQPAASPFFKNKGILTPITHKQPLNISKSEQTPVNFRLCGTTESPDSCSQVTPINKLMEEVRKTNLLGTPQTPPVPKSWYDIKTPDSPFGAFIRPHLSPKSKKELMRYINRIPDFVPPPKERRNSTPLSEVKRRCWKKLLGQQDSPSQFTQDRTEASTSQTESANNDDKEQCQAGSSQINCEAETDSEANVENVFINTKLKQIEDMVNAIGGSRRSSKGFQSTVPVEVGNASVKDSQPFTVGWDYCEEIVSSQQIRIFVISGLEADQRESVTEKIEGLGGRVSDLNSYDPKCTHLICPKPARNEKTLSCMAAGKWILHVSYVDKCVAAGKFLPEENFEFGNPKSKENIPMTSDAENEHRIQCIHWWRKEIARRGYGAFNDMRAIVVAQKREPIVRVIEAGGGTVVDAMPPFDEDVHATHCLLEVRSVSDFSLYNRLAEQGILCLNTLYISDFLYRTNKDIKDAIVPHFTKFYS